MALLVRNYVLVDFRNLSLCLLMDSLLSLVEGWQPLPASPCASPSLQSLLAKAAEQQINLMDSAGNEAAERRITLIDSAEEGTSTAARGASNDETGPSRAKAALSALDDRKEELIHASSPERGISRKDKKSRRDGKLRSHFFPYLTRDGYSFKSSGSTTRFSTRWKFSYSVCTCSCGSDEYSCLYRYGYKDFLVPINKTSPFSSLFRNRYRNRCFFYVVYLSYWGVSGKTYVGHLLGVGRSFNLSIHLVPYLPGCTVFSKASCRTGFYFNPCWTDRYTNNQVFSQLVEYIASSWNSCTVLCLFE
ncbi:hypothetical protein SAY86_006975 [Trapa natans]|uniref:Uncharacterized protein n=1 Tax=Trapa natans TaxID=22666 RepID=A0AAN7Q7W3_TRANT|nr:hypothetical protein SAY86_006975 [Trapa natans]